MSKIRMACARGENQVVIRDFTIIGADNAATQVESRHLCHKYFDVFVRAKNRANRSCDFPWRQACSRYLVKKRLERMVIPAINDSDLHGRLCQSLRRVE